MLNCYCQLSSSVIFRQYGVSQSECKIDRPRPGLSRLSPRPHTEALVLPFRRLCSATIDGASCEEIIYIDSKKCFCMYSIWCYWSIVDTITDKCQWLEYLLIDILNTDKVLYALSVFPCLRFPCSEMLVKLASWHISDMTQNRFFIRYAS
jgi:hypothetical protein